MYRQLKAHPVVVPLAVGLVMYALVTLASAVFDPGPIPWAHNVIGPAVVMVVAWGQSMVLGGRGK